jgi:GTPase SAR1 family protein
VGEIRIEVTGDAGVGKTTVVAALIRHLNDLKFHVKIENSEESLAHTLKKLEHIEQVASGTTITIAEPHGLQPGEGLNYDLGDLVLEEISRQKGFSTKPADFDYCKTCVNSFCEGCPHRPEKTLP